MVESLRIGIFKELVQGLILVLDNTTKYRF